MSWKSPLGGGNPGAFTASVFALDPTARIPLEPLFDFIPGLTPLRVTFDLVNSESIVLEYSITEHVIQGNLAGTPTEITAHIRKSLETLTITGTLAGQFQPTITPQIPGLPTIQATPPIAPGSPFQPSMPPQPPVLVRLDLLRFENLKAIADARRPVMVVTPRFTLIPAGIASLNPTWSNDMGEKMLITMTFREVRIVSPLAIQSGDFAAMASGNNADSSGGAAPQTVNAKLTPSDAPGVAPTVGGGV